MITCNDIASINITTAHYEGKPCSGHSCTITLKDGRQTKCYPSTPDICSIIMDTHHTKIAEHADYIIGHFSAYRNYTREPSNVVLTKIFAEVTNNKN